MGVHGVLLLFGSAIALLITAPCSASPVRSSHSGESLWEDDHRLVTDDDQKRQVFQPWGGKRAALEEPYKRQAFQPWGGKRSSGLENIETTDESSTDDVISSGSDGENKRAFQPWGGKRAFQPWGGKRAFQPWGGKRAFQPWGGKRAFQPWGGKRDISSWEKRAFQPWGGKRSQTASNDDVNNKRAFQPWGGKRAFQPWGGKRGFQPWGGKRAFQPWGGKRAFQPWGGKRAFQPWGGKRDGPSGSDSTNFNENDFKNSGDLESVDDTLVKPLERLANKLMQGSNSVAASRQTDPSSEYSVNSAV